MGMWSFYFLGKVYLSFRGYIRFDFLLNLLFALFLIIPVTEKLPARRLLKATKFVLAIVVAFVLLWHETWFPPLIRTINLLVETGGVSTGFIVRFLSDSVSIVEVGILSLLFVACILLNRKIILTPIALAGIIAVPLFAGKSTTVNMNNYLEKFYHAESKKIVHFPEADASRPDFDIIILNICSLAWDDLRAVNLDNDPFFRQFDLLFTNFNTVSSYTNPSAIRLLRAGCGQSKHEELYQNARNECYILEALRGQGYETYAAIDNVAPSYHFVEDIMKYGRADKPIEISDLTVLQIDFDDTPIYDDLAILDRWWNTRLLSGARKAALYMDITTLHGGAHWANDAQWWEKERSTLYREFAQHLFANLDTFFKTLSESGKNAVVIFLPEHGMALRGSRIQPPDIREIPLPSITTVPVGVKFIGKGFSPLPERQVIVSKPTSYYAYAYLLSAFLSSPRFERETLLTDNVINGIPETLFVSENAASLIVKKDADFFYYGKEKKWEKLPRSVLE